MKNILLASILLPCLLHARVHTKISYTVPEGFISNTALYSSETDAPIWLGQAKPGRHTITAHTKNAANGFLYISATRQSLTIKLTGKALDITNRLRLPVPTDEDAAGATTEVFPNIDKNFMSYVANIQTLAKLPPVISNPVLAKANVQQYYGQLQQLIHFTDSVVTVYPANNVSLFTIFRLARWCAYSPEIYTMLGKLDTSLLANDFAKDLLARRDKIMRDSMAVAGKKPAGIVQKAVTNAKFKGVNAPARLLVYWDDFARLDRELVEETKRLHLLFGDGQLQVNFVYTGTSENWDAMVKQNALPDFANYLRGSKPDQTGTSPILLGNDNTCLLAGIKGYNLYRKINSLQ